MPAADRPGSIELQGADDLTELHVSGNLTIDSLDVGDKAICLANTRIGCKGIGDTRVTRGGGNGKRGLVIGGSKVQSRGKTREDYTLYNRATLWVYFGFRPRVELGTEPSEGSVLSN